jgi:hypothetical protein
MPYDAARTRQLLSIAGAHTNNPAAEYIEELATQLRETVAEITAANEAKVKAEGESNRYATELTTAQRTIREMREGNMGTVEMLKTLEAISRNPKGAKQLAADTLAKLNGGGAGPK